MDDVDGVESRSADLDDAGDDAMECVDDEVEYVLDDKPQMVTQGLYIGSAWAEMSEPALTKAGITDILQVAQGLFPRHPLLFTYMILQVEDSPSTDLVCYFPKCFDFIDRALSKGGNVLVHCAAGVSRSATVVLGYLMARHNLSLTAALEHLKAVRPWVAPNTGFMQQLAAFEAAKCDLSNWRPWQLVWCEQEQQLQRQREEDGVEALELLSLPPQPQPQRWLSIPQPRDHPPAQQQQQQQQQQAATAVLQQQQGRCCSSQPAACVCGSNGGCGSSASGLSSRSHLSPKRPSSRQPAAAAAAAAASSSSGQHRHLSGNGN